MKTTAALAAALALALPSAPARAAAPPAAATRPGVPLADPFVLLHDGVYHAYGTGGGRGIEVYTSADLAAWTPHPAPALAKADSWGEKWFWAPEVYYNKDNKTFYMYYSAEERLCVATAASPLGPFAQKERRPMLDEKAIDSTLFIDDDGAPWLFFVRVTTGGGHKNTIWAAGLERDLVTIKKETLVKCAGASQPWEKKDGNINEGPSVLKRGGVYYMLYSGNGYTSPDYGVGLATAPSPRGPWEKSPDNPLLQKSAPGLVGAGHGAPFADKAGRWKYVFHAHASPQAVHPRKMYITDMSAADGRVTICKNNITPATVAAIITAESPPLQPPEPAPPPPAS
ncbi:MAG: glycoside hydrolase family 43 protein [Opitutaceae bacterium]|jgi:beta-xylosidase|nr:glycoside hydrolase family 43 protein [Opitutaceae bacterium]